MEAKGKKYLKIIGILMIIFGAISTAIFVMGILGTALISGAAAANSQSGVAAIGGVALTLMFGFGTIWSILQLITGIFGVKNCENVAKASTCFKLGVVLIVFSLISSVWSIWVEGFSVTALLNMAVGVILPVLFCYGAKLNQQ